MISTSAAYIKIKTAHQRRRTIVKTNRLPWIIAHRGAKDEAPENSLTALKRALNYDIDGVEFDVQMSSDGIPVLFHDWTLRKVGGGRKRVSDMTCAELERIDWGNWHHPRFAGEPLTTLAKALTLLKRCHNMCIEIKSSPCDQSSGQTAALTDEVLRRIHQPDIEPYKDRILILSFDPAVLIRIDQADTGLRFVLNLPESTLTDTITTTQHLWGVGVNISKLSTVLAQWVRRRNLRLLTYTCNGPRQVKKALQLGVDAIITDRPGWLSQHFKRDNI
jgi:glycerophosphoryl diester phosphodiesterase